MRIGILGSGDVGQSLARGLRALGHEVRIGTREGAKLAAFCAEADVTEGRFAVHLADEDKLRRFREVARDTLLAATETEDDVGLAGAHAPVSGEAMTCIDSESSPGARASAPPTVRT